MRILVIGNGFIASEIIGVLDSEGHQILVFSRSIKDNIQNEQIIGDIFDTGSLNKILRWKPQVVVHTAWVTAHERYTYDLSNYDYAKFTSEFVHTLLKTDLEHFIGLGSCAEYGPQTAPSSAGKTHLNPINLYAQQKVSALNSIKNTIEGSAVRLSWVRVFQPYGPRQDRARLIPYMIEAINSGLRINLRDTSSLHDWVTTRDIASAISFVIRNSLPIELDVGTTIGLTNVQVLKTIEGIIGNSNQWERISTQTPIGNGVAVVGKESPLIESGWNSSDSLKDGLSWVLNS
jgi:UDP-glucuronate decarboxylase